MTTIRSKLYLLVAVLLILGSINAFMGTTGMNQGLISMDSVYRNRIIPLHALQEIADAYAVNIVDTAHQVEDGALQPEDGLKVIQDAERLIYGQWSLYLKTVLTPEEKASIKVLEPQIKSAEDTLDKLKNFIEKKDIEGLKKFNSSELYPSITPLAVALSKLAEYQLDEAEQEHLKYRKQYEVTFGVQLFFIVASFILGLGMAYWLITRAVIRPLHEADSFATAIANGDLSGQIQIENQDEIGKVLLSLMVMQTRLRIIVSEIQSKARELSSSGNRLAEATEKMESTSQQQAESSSCISETVNTIDENVERACKNSEAIYRFIEHSGNVVREGEEIISRINSEIGAVSSSMTDVVQSVDELNHLSEEIRNIITTISALSSQTEQLVEETETPSDQQSAPQPSVQLLAGEIRSQAVRTAESTAAIIGIVERISSNIVRTTQAMEQQIEHIQESNALASRVSAVVKTIDVESRQVMKTVKDISDTLKAQTAASVTLKHYVEEINRVTQSNNVILGDNVTHITRLKNLADKMIASVNQFRL